MRSGILRARGLIGALLYVSIFELVVFGSGRLLQVGPVTLRMALYLVGLAVAGVRALVRGRLSAEYHWLVLAFVMLLASGSLVGLMSGFQTVDIAEDVKPLLFFFSILFFDLAIDNVARVRRVAAIIRAGALVLGVLYSMVLGLVYTGVVPFVLVYTLANRSDEFVFRGDTGVFVYKGFLYLGIGVFFYAFTSRRGDKLLALLLVTTLLLTLTRGLLLATGVVAGIAFLVKQRNSLKGFAAVGVLLSLSLAAWPLFQNGVISRAESDSARLADIAAIGTHTTLPTLVVGRGFGARIGERGRIEESYLEILYKQGVPGLVFWAAVLWLLARDFRVASRRGYGEDALPYLLSGIFVFVESATNPFLTNPIGMSMVLIALVAERVLANSPSVVHQPSAVHRLGHYSSRSTTTLASPVE